MRGSDRKSCFSIFTPAFSRFNEMRCCSRKLPVLHLGGGKESTDFAGGRSEAEFLVSLAGALKGE
jgi:hypothetical protein